MRAKKILFILLIMGILSLLILAQALSQKRTGTIEEISYSNNKITISLKDTFENLIIFDNKPINLKEGDQIEYWGREEIYNGDKQIIVNRLEKITN